MLTSARHALIATMATGFWMGRRNGRKISLSNLQHWILNVLCAQQHTSRKGRRKSSENGIFNLLYFFFFAFCVCNFWENENDCAKQRTNQGRPCQGFHVYITKQLDLLLPVFFCQRREFPSHLWSPEATSMFSCWNETEILCRSNSIKFSNQVARILISVIIRKQLSTASVPHVR